MGWRQRLTLMHFLREKLQVYPIYIRKAGTSAAIVRAEGARANMIDLSRICLEIKKLIVRHRFDLGLFYICN